MVSDLGSAGANSTVFCGFPGILHGFQPNQRHLPPGGAVAPVREVSIRLGKGAVTAAVDALDPQGRKTAARELAEIRQEPAARVGRKRRCCARIIPQ